MSVSIIMAVMAAPAAAKSPARADARTEAIAARRLSASGSRFTSGASWTTANRTCSGWWARSSSAVIAPELNPTTVGASVNSASITAAASSAWTFGCWSPRTTPGACLEATRLLMTTTS
jgi:hypothetical protein